MTITSSLVRIRRDGANVTFGRPRCRVSTKSGLELASPFEDLLLAIARWTFPKHDVHHTGDGCSLPYWRYAPFR